MLVILALSIFVIAFVSSYSLAKYVLQSEIFDEARVAGISASCVIDRSQFYFTFNQDGHLGNHTTGATGGDNKKQVYITVKGTSEVAFRYELVFTFSDWNTIQYGEDDEFDTITPDDFVIVLKKNVDPSDYSSGERELARTAGECEKLVLNGKPCYRYTITCDEFVFAPGQFRDTVIMELGLKDSFEYTVNRRDEVFSTQIDVFIRATQINGVTK